jgi:hypothetical protein
MGLQKSMKTLKTFMTGSNYVNIRKSRSKTGISKTAFVNGLLNDDEFVKGAQGIMNTHGSDLSNKELQSQLQSHVASKSKGKVLVRQGQFRSMGRPSGIKHSRSDMSVAPVRKAGAVIPVHKPKAQPKKSTSLLDKIGDFGERNIDKRTPIDLGEGKMPSWMLDAFKYAVTDQKKPFVFQKEYEMRQAQLDVIDGYNKRKKSGDFAQVKMMGLGGMNKLMQPATKGSAKMLGEYFATIASHDGPVLFVPSGKASPPQEIQIMDDMLRNEQVKGFVQNSKRLESIEQARMKQFNKEQNIQSTITKTHITKPFQPFDPTKNKIVGKPVFGINDDSYANQHIYDEEHPTQTETSTNAKPKVQEPRARNPKEMDWNSNTPHIPKFPTAPWFDRDVGIGGRQKSRTKQDGARPDESKTEVTDDSKPDTKRDPKFKPKPILKTRTKVRKKPKIKDDDSESEESEPEIPSESEPDEEPENKTENPSIKRDKEGVRGHLKPYFLVGGQDILKITKQEALQEITDRHLFDFVPAYVNQKDNSVVTQFERDQYNFRYRNTKPNPRPRPRYKRASNNQLVKIQPMMRDVHRTQALHNPRDTYQYDPIGRMSNQSRSTIISTQDFHKRPNIYPDVLQQVRVPRNKLGLRQGLSLDQLSIDIASKSMI